MYIVIEKFNVDYPTIVTDEDGKPLIFDELTDAEQESNECQDGQVVEI